MAEIRVLIHGVSGRMGQETLKAVCEAEDTRPVGGVDIVTPDNRMRLPDGSGSIPLSSDLPPSSFRPGPKLSSTFPTPTPPSTQPTRHRSGRLLRHRHLRA